MGVKSGVITHQVCGGLITYSVEWSVEQDLAYSTNKYTAKLYMDASAAKYLKTSGSGDRYSSLYISNGEGNSSGDVLIQNAFKAPTYSSLTGAPGKVLLSSVSTEAIAVGEEPVDIKVGFYIYPNEKLRAYSNLISYTESADYISKSEILTIDGHEQSAISAISGDFLLGKVHTLTVDRGNTEFLHSIEYICGKEKITLCENSTEESFSFTPAEALAAQNTEGVTVDATFYIHTYYNGKLKGTKTAERVFNIPNSVKPSCTFEVVDGETRDGEYLSSFYGGFVQRRSRFRVITTPTPAYGSPIEEYTITANGTTVTTDEAELETAAIKNAGAQTITVWVKDARGRISDPATVSVNVLPYTVPVVSALRASRCDADGTDNDMGGCIKVIFSADVSALNNHNSATYVVNYSKASGLDMVEKVIAAYTGQYTVSDGVYIFEADIDEAYVIQVTVLDDFDSHSRMTGGGLATILMNWLASGRGMCFGGVATIENAVECKFKFYPSGGLIIPPFPYDNLFIRDPNVYYVENPADINGCPVDDPFILEIYPISADGLDIMQRLTTCPTGEAPRIIVRVLQNSSWGSFYDMTTGQSI